MLPCVSMEQPRQDTWDQIATDDAVAGEVREFIRKHHAKASARSLVWNFLVFFPMIRRCGVVPNIVEV